MLEWIFTQGIRFGYFGQGLKEDFQEASYQRFGIDFEHAGAISFGSIRSF